MDGVSALNNDKEGEAGLEMDSGRIRMFESGIGNSGRISWPQYEALQWYYNSEFGGGTPYMDQFQLDTSCDLRTVMCCFTDMRDGAALATNADVCEHDLAHSAKSNHIANGWANYGSIQGRRGSRAKCVGFSWPEDENTDAYQYKGNALFHISFRAMLNEGTVKGIPGAPMCGCVENMPAVSRADCRKVNVSGERHSIFNSNGNFVVVQTGAQVSVSTCPTNDLAKYYEDASIGTTDEVARLTRHHLVGACDTAVALNSRFFVPDDQGTALAMYTEPDPAKWKKVAGQGLLYSPIKNFDMGVRDREFRNLLAANPGAILYRRCVSCKMSHQDIYYVRLTPYPPEGTVNLLDMFLNNWKSNGNTLGTDFELYSTYEEAVARAGGEWTSCNYDRGNRGFPNECGPTELVHCQWNSYRSSPCTRGEYNGRSNAFYVELTSTA